MLRAFWLQCLLISMSPSCICTGELNWFSCYLWHRDQLFITQGWALRKRVERTPTSMQVDLRSVNCYDLQGGETTLRLLKDSSFWHLTHHSRVHAGWSSPWFQGKQSGRRRCRDSTGGSMPRGLGPALFASVVDQHRVPLNIFIICHSIHCF